jgi:hypothetical protein
MPRRILGEAPACIPPQTMPAARNNGVVAYSAAYCVGFFIQTAKQYKQSRGPKPETEEDWQCGFS